MQLLVSWLAQQGQQQLKAAGCKNESVDGNLWCLFPCVQHKCMGLVCKWSFAACLCAASGAAVGHLCFFANFAKRLAGR